MKIGEYWIPSAENADIATLAYDYLLFVVSNEQKDYMNNHKEEVKEYFENKFDLKVNTISFEPFWDGVEDCWECEVTFVQ